MRLLWLALALALLVASPAAAVVQTCTLNGTGFKQLACSGIADVDCTGSAALALCAEGYAPDGDDALVIHTGLRIFPVASPDDDLKQAAGAGTGITVQSGGELGWAVVTALGTLTPTVSTGDAGLVCEAGSTCTFNGMYRQFNSAAGVPALQAARNTLYLGDIIPCYDAAADEIDCSDATLKNRIRIEYPLLTYDSASTEVGDTFLGEEINAIADGEVLCIYDENETTPEAPGEDNLCYVIIDAVIDSAACADIHNLGGNCHYITIDVRQTDPASPEEAAYTYPLADRAVFQGTVAVATESQSRYLLATNTLIDYADQDHGGVVTCTAASTCTIVLEDSDLTHFYPPGMGFKTQIVGVDDVVGTITNATYVDVAGAANDVTTVTLSVDPSDLADGLLVGEEFKFSGRALRLGDRSTNCFLPGAVASACPTSETYVIERIWNDNTTIPGTHASADVIQVVGIPDNGTAIRTRQPATATDLFTVDYSLRTGDPAYVMAPAKLTMTVDSETASVPFTFDGTTTLRAVLVDDYDRMQITDDATLSTCSDIWFRDPQAGQFLEIDEGVIQDNPTCNRIRSTGGSTNTGLRAEDVNHGLGLGLDAEVASGGKFTLTNLACRHMGDDCLYDINFNYDSWTMDVKRVRSDLEHRLSSGGIYDFNPAGDIENTTKSIKGVYCGHCTDNARNNEGTDEDNELFNIPPDAGTTLRISDVVGFGFQDARLIADTFGTNAVIDNAILIDIARTGGHIVNSVFRGYTEGTNRTTIQEGTGPSILNPEGVVQSFTRTLFRDMIVKGDASAIFRVANMRDVIFFDIAAPGTDATPNEPYLLFLNDGNQLSQTTIDGLTIAFTPGFDHKYETLIRGEDVLPSVTVRDVLIANASSTSVAAADWKPIYFNGDPQAANFFDEGAFCFFNNGKLADRDVTDSDALRLAQVPATVTLLRDTPVGLFNAFQGGHLNRGGKGATLGCGAKGVVGASRFNWAMAIAGLKPETMTTQQALGGGGGSDSGGGGPY